MTKQIQNPKSKIQNWWISVSVLVLTAGCGPAATAQPVSTAVTAEAVLVGKPTRKTLTLTTTQPARVEGLERAPIHSKLAAYVAEVLVDYGDAVKKDQPLIRLYAPEIDAAVNQKKALLSQARAEYAQAHAGASAASAAVSTAKARLAQTEAGLTRSQADVERWRSEFNRYEQLAGGGSVNRQLVDETQQKLRAVEASLKETQAAIDAAKAGLAQSQAEAAKAAADVDAAQAKIGVAEANLSQADAMRSYLTIPAPFDGIVTTRQIDPGHFVQPAGSSATPLMTVARTDKIRVFAAVPENEAPLVEVGNPVIVEVQSLRGAEIKGKVTRTSVALDPGSRSLETIIDLDNASQILRPGLYATAKITLAEQPNALTLPTAAVARQGKEAFCYRLRDGKASKTPIEVGIKVGDDVEIKSGLSDADTVILNKAASLKDGQPVEVVKPQAKK